MRVEALCQKVFSQPSRGTVTARPIGKHVMFTWGVIDRVVSETPPYDQRGGVSEPQVAIWIPVVLQAIQPLTMSASRCSFLTSGWTTRCHWRPAGSCSVTRRAGGSCNFPPMANPPVWKVDAFGLDYTPDALAAIHPLLEVVRTGSIGAGDRARPALTRGARPRHGRASVRRREPARGPRTIGERR